MNSSTFRKFREHVERTYWVVSYVHVYEMMSAVLHLYTLTVHVHVYVHVHEQGSTCRCMCIKQKLTLFFFKALSIRFAFLENYLSYVLLHEISFYV